jgi:hypothetical protein
MEEEEEFQPQTTTGIEGIEGIDEISKKILVASGILVNSKDYPDEILILRDMLINNEIYVSLKNDILELKKNLSSSSLTSLQKSAEKTQKWPLLNLVRQILNVYGFKMIPIRKCDGYTLDGIKRFKRYFQVVKKIEVNQVA